MRKSDLLISVPSPDAGLLLWGLGGSLPCFLNSFFSFFIFYFYTFFFQACGFTVISLPLALFHQLDTVLGSLLTK